MSLRRLVPMLILTLWSAARDSDGERTDSARVASPQSSAGGGGAGVAGVDIVGGSGGGGCPVGCELCSDENGCLKCEADYSFLLVRKFMSQKGDCVKECPAGYYLDEDGYQRHKIRKCHQCRIKHCEACDQRAYCTRCRPPFLEYRGRCISECARGLYYANYTKDCLPKVDCVVGSWSEWSDCTRDGRTCGFKYGRQTRSLEILQAPTSNGRPCPVVANEERTCSLARRRCPDEQLAKAVAGGGDSRLRPAAVAGSPVSDEPADEPLAVRRRWPAQLLPSGYTNDKGEDVASPKDAPSEVGKPKRPSKPSISCNSKNRSRLPDALVGSEPSTAGCHRVRHGQGAHAAQTPAASGEQSPSARTLSSSPPPPPPMPATRSRSTAPASQKSGAIVAIMPDTSAVTFATPEGSAAGERSRNGVNGDASTAFPPSTIEPTASTAMSTSALVQAAYEPPPHAAAPPPKVTDVKAAEYYHYYLTSSRQRQRQGSSRVAPAAVAGAAASAGA